jgi:hypothetical protein
MTKNASLSSKWAQTTGNTATEREIHILISVIQLSKRFLYFYVNIITSLAKSAKTFVVYSDLHIGSKYSVCSEEPELDDGSYRPSPNQKKMMEAWYDARDAIITKKPDFMVINGEPIDGDNFKSLGDSVWTTDLGNQMTDAEKLVKMVPHDKLYLVRGSGYHVTRGATNFEKIFGKKIGAETYKSVLGNRTKADFEATFKVNDKHIHFTHHVGYSGWWMYRPTPISRELVKMHFNHAANGFHTDLLIRSHVHYYVEVRFPHTIGLSTPAWKFPDGWMYRQGEPELPTIGNIEIIVESNGKLIVEPHLIDVNWRKPVIHVQ